jgi:Fe2+ transport protein
MAKTSQVRRPPSKPSEEADRRQLRQAKAEGKCYLASLDYMVNKVADAGGKQRAGDYIVAFAQEKAEGMYHLKRGKLRWMEPKNENCHIEVAVLDATDKRFVPFLSVRARISARSGKTIASFAVPFVWHPGLYHYGRNVTVPASGRYDLNVAIEAPRFMRHDRINGKRYAKRVAVTFRNIAIKAGKG